MHHGATVDDGLFRVHYRIDADGVGLRAEEIAYVDRVELLFVANLFEYIVASEGAYIANHIHIPDCVLRLAHKVDEIACRLHVLGILRYHPAVEPYDGTGLGNRIGQFHTHLGSFFDSPLGITAPGKVDPCLFLGHLILAEIGLPAADAVTEAHQIVLDHLDGFVGVVEADGGEVFLSGIDGVLVQGYEQD